MKASSPDLGERIIHTIVDGMPRAEIVRTLAAGPATIARYLRRLGETGNLVPWSSHTV